MSWLVRDGEVLASLTDEGREVVERRRLVVDSHQPDEQLLGDEDAAGADGVGGVAQILFAVLDNQPASLVTGDFLVT